MKILVSACLLGENCKYNGGNNLDERVLEYVRGHEVIRACPEYEAGLGCPRTPMEIVDGVLVNKDGVVVDGPVREAIGAILARLEGEQVDCAVLKSRSPTCGVHEVYDGTFSGKRIPGSGVFARALMDAGIHVIDAEDL